MPAVAIAPEQNLLLRELRALRAQVNRLESRLAQNLGERSAARLTTTEVAKLYRTSRERIRAFCESGELPAQQKPARGRMQWTIRADDAELILPGLLARSAPALQAHPE